MAIGGLFQAVGFYQMSKAARQQGKMAAAEKRFEAAQAREQAGLARAVGGYNMLEQKRQSKIVQSRIQALVAAGGGGTLDPSIVNLIGDQEAEGSFRAAMALYEGESKARNLRMQASALDYEARMAEIGGINQSRAYQWQALGAVFDAGQGFMPKGGGGG